MAKVSVRAFGDQFGQWPGAVVMRAVGRLGQAADVLAHGVAPDPEPPGDLPQGEALNPTKVLTWRVSPRAHPAPSPICSRKGYAQSSPPRWQVCRRHCQHVGLGTTSNCWRTPRRGRAVNQRRRSGTCRYRTPHTRPEARGGRFSWSRAPRPETESSPGTSGSRFL